MGERLLDAGLAVIGREHEVGVAWFTCARGEERRVTRLSF
jgi:hypothetical protein